MSTQSSLYRSFCIYDVYGVRGIAYQYVHTDYDGPEDSRIGHGATMQDCVNAIDDWYDDQLFCEQCDSTGIIHIGNRPYPNDPRSIEETFSEECEQCSAIREKLLIPENLIK